MRYDPGYHSGVICFRGRKELAWILGFFQAMLFVIAITTVLSNMNNFFNVIAYAAGFATGNVVGMSIENRMAIGHIHMTIFSPMAGPRIADALRNDGYAVTEISGRGLSGMVSVLHIAVLRKKVGDVEKIVHEMDKDAFVTAQDVRSIRRGFWRA